MVGFDGIMHSGYADPNYIDGSGTVDQGEPDRTWFFAHPRAYTDCCLGSLPTGWPPEQWRLEIGWIGEYLPWTVNSTPIQPWRLSDYTYAWWRAHDTGHPITYRTSMQSLWYRDANGDPDAHILKIGQLESTPPTAADVGPIWSSVAVSADGTTLAAAAYGGRLYTSTDNGTSWAERQPAGDTDHSVELPGSVVRRVEDCGRALRRAAVRIDHLRRHLGFRRSGEAG